MLKITPPINVIKGSNTIRESTVQETATVNIKPVTRLVQANTLKILEMLRKDE